jgi:hypothetical protein
MPTDDQIESAPDVTAVGGQDAIQGPLTRNVARYSSGWVVRELKG